MEVRFRRFTTARSTIRLRDGHVRVHVSDLLAGAPAPVLEALAFILLAKLIRLRATPVIVSSEVEWASSDEIRSLRDSLAATVEAWRRDWESLDTARYLAHYSEAFRAGRMDLKSWTAHKTRVNRSKSFVKVELADIGIYRYPGEEGLFMVTFRQSYRSSNFQGHRWKQQFWRLENGAWRILHEGGV